MIFKSVDRSSLMTLEEKISKARVYTMHNEIWVVFQCHVVSQTPFGVTPELIQGQVLVCNPSPPLKYFHFC